MKKVIALIVILCGLVSYSEADCNPGCTQVKLDNEITDTWENPWADWYFALNNGKVCPGYGSNTDLPGPTVYLVNADNNSDNQAGPSPGDDDARWICVSPGTMVSFWPSAESPSGYCVNVVIGAQTTTLKLYQTNCVPSYGD